MCSVISSIAFANGISFWSLLLNGAFLGLVFTNSLILVLYTQMFILYFPLYSAPCSLPPFKIGPSFSFLILDNLSIENKLVFHGFV